MPQPMCAMPLMPLWKPPALAWLPPSPYGVPSHHAPPLNAARGPGGLSRLISTGAVAKVGPYLVAGMMLLRIGVATPLMLAIALITQTGARTDWAVNAGAE